MKKISFIHFEQVDSTNKWVKRNYQNLSSDQITCVIADLQTEGIGTRQRKWISPKGNLYVSLFFTLPKNCLFLPHLAQFASFCAALALRKLGFNPNIKWPNDLILSSKKVGGILAEIVELPEAKGVILGVGLNLNMSTEDLAHIDQPATSLKQESGTNWAVDRVLLEFLEQFKKAYPRFAEEGFTPFVEEFEALLTVRPN